MSKGSGTRSRQRRYALRILFEVDINRCAVKEVLDGKREVGEDPPSEFTIQLVEGVLAHRAEIDRVISQYSEGWDLDRMPVVDRNILRMSIFELFFLEDIPPGPTIDEAVELAKSFSTEDSGKFVNGVLGKVNLDRESGRLVIPGRQG
ncbi:MAG: transcription antitermination factor NusB [Actinobacteria bacterium]|nr:transcription antitermination factor NusB [Actinomycetota bacterium]MBU1942220.1 transcription antitermination factor NusB [Actinomycetota bacterium]MBU2687431.1 transcription antitermination factor NusB [Actinomycetota bacterium]